MSPFQGWFYVDGLHPSLIYAALSGLVILSSFRWAAPIVSILRPFRAGFLYRLAAPAVSMSMGCTHRWCITPFQGVVLLSSALKGRYTSTLREALRFQCKSGSPERA
jgi:hypothetical protein